MASLNSADDALTASPSNELPPAVIVRRWASSGAALIPVVPTPQTGLSPGAIRHFSKALSQILRHELHCDWADTSFVLAQIRTSRSHGALTATNLADVMRGNRRFEMRNLGDVPQIRAIRR